MQCELCGGEMWDNTVNKKNPKGPDYKCKDKECGHAVWLKPKTTPPATKPAPVAHNGEDVKVKAMIMAYAKDLVVAETAAGTPPPNMAKQTIAVFLELWQAYKEA